MSSRPVPSMFTDATWDEILPLYDELANAELHDGVADAWLERWSRLDEAVMEAHNRAGIDYTADTTDPAKEAAYVRFTSEIGPKLEEQQVRLGARLLDLDLDRPELATTLCRFRNQRDLFRAENVARTARVEQLNTEYQKLTGAMTAEWDGEQLPLPRLQPFLLDPRRDIRERAFRLRAKPYVEARDRLADIFDEQFKVRGEIARAAGFENYRDYMHREKNRFDYTPVDCERFQQAVEQTVTPAVARSYDRKARQLGVATLRPWDTGVDARGRPALKPFDSAETLIRRAQEMFRRVDPVLGGYFNTMAAEKLLDLESRTGKAPGGYCTGLPYSKRPFIFMNAAGVQSDVETLLHEAGHAFHSFEAYKLPFYWQRHPGSEMAEVASMSMELLAAPYLAESDGGYYSPEEARRARAEHLESLLRILPHIASVDAFQHWLYTSGEGHDRDARDAAWLRIRSRFEVGIDWTGLEAERTSRWYQQLHIFLYPFYYIEYGIAQLGALQVWRNALDDQAAAVAAYRGALALGGSRPLPELFEAAGARLAFDAETMGSLVGLVERRLAGETAA